VTRRLLACLILVLAVACVIAAAAPAASRFYIRGRGYGHGVGMSQYGAYGFALHGKDWRFILDHYYTGTTITPTAGNPGVRVLLRSGVGAVSFSGASRMGARRLRPTSRYRVARRGAVLELRSPSGRRLARFSALARATGPGPLTVYGTASNGVRNGAYRGALELRPSLFGGMNVVNAVRLETYLRGVVPAEMPAIWPIDALRAQAVAARTYALTTDAGGNGFDQYADTRSQVYRGVETERPTSDQAIRDTAGQLVTYGGRPITTFFFSTSGGRTEDVQFSFLGSQPDPWLVSVDDPFDNLSPKHTWGPTSATLAHIGRELGGYVKGSFRGIDVIQRGASPRVVYADVIGTGGRTRVTGPTLRARLGLNDTWAYFTTITSKSQKPPPPEPTPQAGVPNETGGGATAPTAGATIARVRLLAGQVIGVRGSARAVLQRRLSGRWRTIGPIALGADGRYRVPVAAGAYRVRYGALVGPPVQVG
jgi:stage II sporulation protein D